MGIKIGFNKTVVNGVRGREIQSIRALDKEHLPEEYLEQLGAVHLAGAPTDVQSLQIRRALASQSSESHQKHAHIPLLSVGMWMPEARFATKMALILKAGDLLREVNKQVSKEWAGNELVSITADGVEEGSTSLLQIHLCTSKVYKNKQKYRGLNGVVVTADGTTLSEEVCDQAHTKALNVIDKLRLFGDPVIEREFQNGVSKLKHLVRRFEHRFWQGKGTIVI